MLRRILCSSFCLLWFSGQAVFAAPFYALQLETVRQVYQRLEKNTKLQWKISNQSLEELRGATLHMGGDIVPSRHFHVPALAAGQYLLLETFFDSSLESGIYPCQVSLRDKNQVLLAENTFSITLVNRPLPAQMPVVQWGMFNMNRIFDNIDVLQQIGFTHALCRFYDMQSNWNSFDRVVWGNWELISTQKTTNKKQLDELLARNFHVAMQPLSLAYTRTKQMPAELQERYRRRDRNGDPYPKFNLCGNFSEIQELGKCNAASLARTFQDYPAWDMTLINTEIRDATALCFHDHDRQAFKEYAGFEIPDEAEQAYGISYLQLTDFPRDRVIPDDYPLLKFYRWFWKNGDGWNKLHSQLHQGIKNHRPDVRTWFDPAVRCPSIYGSGGDVDILSNWTYTHLGPELTGLATDQLMAMAGGSTKKQDVMKMTQLFWKRFEVAPKPLDSYQAEWEKTQPDARFFTISPDHLKIAFWSKISRPVKGIMYHGWASIVNTGHGGYRYTHPDTATALAGLIENIIKPLGPTLVQIPDRQSQVAFLESFSSQMFAGRGTRGWGRGWGGSSYLIARYAHLQPEIIYEETILQKGLLPYKILLLMHCDVLPQGVVDSVIAFQRAGGILIADENLCPAISPDILIESDQLTRIEENDKQVLQQKARQLRELLDPHFQRYSDASNMDLFTRVRTSNSADYLFVYNDKRTYGNYVGHHKRVMENGVANSGTVQLLRQKGFVYDLTEHRQIHCKERGNQLQIPVELPPGGGKLFLATTEAISSISIRLSEPAQRKFPLIVKVQVLDPSGLPCDAVVPLEVRILDSLGRLSEFSGHYGAKDGTAQLQLDLAGNAPTGIWKVQVRELASGLSQEKEFQVDEE